MKIVVGGSRKCLESWHETRYYFKEGGLRSPSFSIKEILRSLHLPWRKRLVLTFTMSDLHDVFLTHNYCTIFIPFS